MKKLHMLCIVLLIAAGCTKNDAPKGITVEGASIVISAESPTRTSYEENLTTAYWNATDQLGVYVCRNFSNGYASTIENLRYDNAGNDLSSVARFTSTATFNVKTGDVIVGYYPYSSEQTVEIEGSLDSGSRAIAYSLGRPFTLGAQVQNGNASTAHIGANDFLVATPTEVAASMIEGTTVTVPFTFTHAFAIIKFNVANKYARAFTVTGITIESADSETALTGEVAIDIVNPTVKIVNGTPSVALTVENSTKTAVDETFTGYLLVNAATLPIASTITVTTSLGRFQLQTTSAIDFYRGKVTTLNFNANEERLIDKPASQLAECWGSWKLSTYCGQAAGFDVYMVLGDDYSFTLYQRANDYEVSKFTGTYTFDASANIFGGEYSDGTPWATTYALEEVTENTLTWSNTANDAEVSVYVKADVPDNIAGATVAHKSAKSVKRFL